MTTALIVASRPPASRKPRPLPGSGPLALLLLAATVLLTAGCASVDTRIEAHATEFYGYPPAVQERLRTGKIELGDTRMMVEIALGRPDRVYSRTTEAGATDVWAYVGNDPRFSVGVGVGFGEPYPYYGPFSTILVDSDRDARYERLRIEFAGDVVKALERVQRRR